MATLLAPFNNAMKLGSGQCLALVISSWDAPGHGHADCSGFNSFTQELCVDHAVVAAADEVKAEALKDLKQAGVAQSVTYKTAIVTKVTDVTDALNVRVFFTSRIVTYV